MKKKYFGLIATLLVVLIVLFSFILYNEWPLLTGKKIVLATEPIDPFDPFRGQYMAINYEISTIQEAQTFNSGDRLYVLLEEDDSGIWRYDGYSKTKPSEGDFIKGEVIYSGQNYARVEYGIEQFFFEKGAYVPSRNITVEVKVAGSGRAGMVQLLQNGEPVEIESQGFNLRH